MNILTVMHDFRGGGAEKVAVLLANEWRAQGCQSEIFCVSEAGAFRDRVDAGVPIHCFGKAHAYEAIMSLAAVLRKNHDAVVVSHLTHMNVVCLLAAGLAGHRRVFVVEHNDFDRSRRDAASFFAKGGFVAAPFLYKFACNVICVSQSVRKSLPASRHAPHARACVIANPIDVSEFTGCDDAPDLHPWFAEGRPVLVACGRLAHQKNYDLMLHALGLVLQGRSVKLIVLGEGPERERLVALAGTLGVEDSVDFIGFRKNPSGFFAKARLFISTSAFEGLPMTMIEALFAGANLVVTDSCSDAGKLVNQGFFGVCVASDQPEAFAGAILQELGKPVASLAEKRRFLASFALPDIASQYVDLFCKSASLGEMEAPCSRSEIVE